MAIAQVLLAGTACGSRTSVGAADDPQSSESTSQQEAGSAAPTHVEMTCREMESNIQLTLPCEVGMSLAGAPGEAGVNAVQCDLVNGGPIGTMGLLMPLRDIGTTRLHQPVNIETDLSVVPPSELILDTRKYRLISAKGTLVLDSVDLAARSFNGRIYDFVSDWTDNITGKHSPCTVPDGPIWAVPGGFR